MTSTHEQTSCPLLWPEACEALRLDDAVMGQAYESVQPSLRACLKTGIAFQYALHGEQPDQHLRYTCDSARGFTHCVKSQPAAWTVLFMGPDYASGPRLIAALMPALLARVPLVGVVCLGGLPSVTACASLELLGIEDIFCFADTDAAQHLLQQLAGVATAPAWGRALFLHKGELALLEYAARQLGFATWHESAAPRIALHKSSGCDLKTLQWCHPDVLHMPENENGAENRACRQDAVFSAVQPLLTTAIQNQNAPLLLGAGMEGVWWHKHLEPAFFMEKQLQASCTIDHHSEESAL